MVLFLLIAAGLQAGHRLAADLRPGMQLVYASNGVEQPAWTVDSLTLCVSYAPRSGCARLLIRRRAWQAQPDESRLCVEHDTVFAWNARREGWYPQRPVGARMALTTVTTAGDTVHYATGDVTEETISDRRLTVVHTTVTTVDSLGRPKRRLRERYAPSLATATGGRFEVPDPAAPEGWRVEQEFEPRAIRVP